MNDNDEKAWEDPIVAEVRKVRDEYAKKFNYDLKAMFEDMKNRRAEFEKMGFKYVKTSPKKAKPAA